MRPNDQTSKFSINNPSPIRNEKKNNRDLVFQTETGSQPDFRIKTSLGGYRSTSPKTKVKIA